MNERESSEKKRTNERKEIYDNMYSAVAGSSALSGVNAILDFFNLNDRVDSGLTIEEQLKQVEDNLPLLLRRVRLDADWNHTSSMPMLAETTDERWLAVIPRTDGKCFAVERGRRRIIREYDKKFFTGNAIYFYRKVNKNSIRERDLLTLMIRTIPVKSRVIILMASAAVIFTGMLLPWVYSFVFSEVIPSGSMTGINAATMLMLSAISIVAVINILQRLLITNVMLRIAGNMQSVLFSRLLSLRPDFFRDERSGELSRRIMEFTDLSRTFPAQSLCACLNFLLSFLYLIQIFIYAPELSAWILCFTIIMIGIILVEGMLRMRWSRQYQTVISSMSGFCYELFSEMEHIKLNGAENRMLHRFSEKYADVSKKEDPPFFVKYSAVFYKILVLISTAVIFLLGTQLSVSDYVAFFTAYGAYTAAIYGLSESSDTISSFHIAYTQIKPVFTAEYEETGENKLKIEHIDGDIAISDLYFRYEEDSPYVINGLSLNIKHGESIGIIGTSGCGKSTLIRLLTGFEKPEKGSIYIDRYDLRELDLKSFRGKIGTVLQNADLLSGDIFANITITKPDAELSEVEEAVRMAGLAQDISALPMGLRTPVNPENPNLSGGQKQRLLIARAILSKPSVMIFDEATSALDNTTQAKVADNINSLPCTKIIIAHRISTIRNCDRIYVMDKGQFVQQGTYEELKATEGLFARFVRRQSV